MEPTPHIWVKERQKIELGPIGGELEYDPMKKIEKSVEDPVFEVR
jgi:hypothetical protein